MTGKTIGWHSDDVAEPSQLSLHDDVLHGVDVGSAADLYTVSKKTVPTYFLSELCQISTDCTGWAKKTGPFFRVHKFVTVGARNVCDMSKFSKFYLEKNVKLAFQCI